MTLWSVSANLKGIVLPKKPNSARGRKLSLAQNRSPSFRGFKAVSSLTSRTKKANCATDTLHELILANRLRRLGLNFRRHVEDLPGKPDLVFHAAQVAVFCDGDFWHGRNWRVLRTRLARGSNAKYWVAKISCNISRDRRVNLELARLDWCALRVWEGDVRQSPEKVANRIAHLVRRRLQRRIGE